MDSLCEFSAPSDPEFLRALEELTPAWMPASVNDESQARQAAIGLLTACGLVQQKRRIEATAPGLPGIYRATLRILGIHERPDSNADGPLTRTIKAYLPREWSADGRRVLLRLSAAHALRLTTMGEAAKADVLAGDGWKVLVFMHSLPYAEPAITVESQEFVILPPTQAGPVAVAHAQTGDVTVNNQISMPPVVVNVAMPPSATGAAVANVPAPPAQGANCSGGPVENEPPRRATANARMIDLMKDPATHSWSSQQFAVKLGVAKSTVAGTEAWKQLQTSREMARQERATRKQSKWQAGQ